MEASDVTPAATDTDQDRSPSVSPLNNDNNKSNDTNNNKDLAGASSDDAGDDSDGSSLGGMDARVPVVAAAARANASSSAPPPPKVAGSMVVWMRALTGDEFPVSVLDEATVLDLKIEVERLRGIPVTAQVLVWRRESLLARDGLRLQQDLHVEHGDALQLLLSMSGGQSIVPSMFMAPTRRRTGRNTSTKQQRSAARKSSSSSSSSTVLYLCRHELDIYLLEIELRLPVRPSTSSTLVGGYVFNGVVEVDELTPDAILTELHRSGSIQLSNIEKLAVDALVTPDISSSESSPVMERRPAPGTKDALDKGGSRASSAGSVVSAASTASVGSLESLFRAAKVSETDGSRPSSGTSLSSSASSSSSQERRPGSGESSMAADRDERRFPSWQSFKDDRPISSIEPRRRTTKANVPHVERPKTCTAATAAAATTTTSINPPTAPKILCAGQGAGNEEEPARPCARLGHHMEQPLATLLQVPSVRLPALGRHPLSIVASGNGNSSSASCASTRIANTTTTSTTTTINATSKPPPPDVVLSPPSSLPSPLSSPAPLQLRPSEEALLLLNSHPHSQLPPPPKERVLTASARCHQCAKRLTFGGSVFRCKCTHTFCADHRYTDRHQCQHDYKKPHQLALARQNPVVVRSKI